MSEVWQVFIKTECGLRAQCTLCKKTYANLGTNTTNFWTHLQSKHKDKYKELDNQRKGFSSELTVNDNEIDELSFSSTAATEIHTINSTTTGLKIKNEKTLSQSSISFYTITKAAQAKIDNALAYFISVDMMPYSIVEKEGFKMYTNALNTSYKIPSRKTITESKIPHLYDITKENVVSIAKNAIFMSFTTDCWTSAANQPFMALTGHYIDGEFNLGCICLGCIELIEDHTGDNIADALIMLLLEYSIDISSKKICSFTTDHGTNVIKAIENLNVTHIPCFGHAFNIAVGQIFLLVEVDEAVDKAKKIQNIFAHSWQAVRQLKIEQDRFGLKRVKLPSYSKTRWWSLLDLIIVIINQELALSSFLRTYKRGKFKKLIINDEQIEVLRAIEIILNPLRHIADNLAAETYITASAIYPVLNNIKSKMKEVSSNNEIIAQLNDKIYTTIVNLLDKRYDNNLALQMSMVLDPRFKTKYLLSENDIMKIKCVMKTKCLSAWREWLCSNKDNNETGVIIGNDRPLKKIKQTGLWALFGEPDDSIQTNQSQNKENDTTLLSKIEKEINFYTGLPIISFCQPPLKWWNLNSSMYPFLTILARKLLTIQATSVPSERVFSKGGLVVTDHRAALTNDHVSQLVFLSSNKAYVPIPL